MSEYITQAEAAALLSVSIKTITRLRHDGQLPFVKVRNSIRIKRSDIEWQLNYRQGLVRKQTDIGMSTGMMASETENIAYGRKIARQQRLGFSAG